MTFQSLSSKKARDPGEVENDATVISLQSETEGVAGNVKEPEAKPAQTTGAGANRLFQPQPKPAVTTERNRYGIQGEYSGC
jgi:hypothetical protein